MSLIKRLSVSLFSKVESIVGEIENHEALIQATINEQREKIAHAKVQLAKLQRQEQRVQQQVDELNTKEISWTKRATQAAKTDEARAMACLQQRQIVRSEIQKLSNVQQAYQNAANKMAKDMSRCNDELSTISQKYELLQARKSSSEALSAAHDSRTTVCEISNSFDQWEVQINHQEMIVDSEPMEPLEQDYLKAEQEEQLRAELNLLLKNNAGEKQI
jgi:phage shock protein A